VVSKMDAERRLIYTHNEKKYLTSLVNKYLNVIDSKKNDGRTILQKKQTWDHITYEYCLKPEHRPRSTRQLKKCWENIKTLARKNNKDKQVSVSDISQFLIDGLNEETTALNNTGVECQSSKTQVSVDSPRIIRIDQQIGETSSSQPEAVWVCVSPETVCSPAEASTAGNDAESSPGHLTIQAVETIQGFDDQSRDNTFGEDHDRCMEEGSRVECSNLKSCGELNDEHSYVSNLRGALRSRRKISDAQRQLLQLQQREANQRMHFQLREDERKEKEHQAKLRIYKLKEQYWQAKLANELS